MVGCRGPATPRKFLSMSASAMGGDGGDKEEPAAEIKRLNEQMQHIDSGLVISISIAITLSIAHSLRREAA